MPGTSHSIRETFFNADNLLGDYSEGFTSCKSDSGTPAGLYPQADGTTSTFQQGQGATPAAVSIRLNR